MEPRSFCLLALPLGQTGSLLCLRICLMALYNYAVALEWMLSSPLAPLPSPQLYLSGISGLSFDSPFLSPLLLIYLVLIFSFCLVICLLMAPSPDFSTQNSPIHFAFLLLAFFLSSLRPKNTFSLRDTFFVVCVGISLVEQLKDDTSWVVCATCCIALVFDVCNDFCPFLLYYGTNKQCC